MVVWERACLQVKGVRLLVMVATGGLAERSVCIGSLWRPIRVLVKVRRSLVIGGWRGWCSGNWGQVVGLWELGVVGMVGWLILLPFP